MKVQWIVNNIEQIGGVERVVCNLSNYFSGEGIETEIISIGTQGGQPYFTLKSNIKIKHLGRALWTRREYIAGVKAAIPMLNGDIVIACHPTISNILLAYRRRIKGKIIITQHCNIDFHSKMRNAIDAFFWRFADKVLVLTEYDKQYYISRGLTNCIVMPNAIDEFTERKSELTEPVIITAGRLVAVKGYDFLIRAFAIFHKLYPQWVLRILGDGEEKNRLKQLAMELGVGECVELPGFTPKVLEEFSNASIFVLSSHSEGVSMVLLEAMLTGLPVVTSDLPAAKEILTDDCGVFVQRNEQMFADALEKMACSRQVREEYSRKSIERVNDFKMCKIGSRWLSLFDEIL